MTHACAPSSKTFLAAAGGVFLSATLFTMSPSGVRANSASVGSISANVVMASRQSVPSLDGRDGLPNVQKGKHAPTLAPVVGKVYAREAISDLEKHIADKVGAIRVKRSGRVSELFRIGIDDQSDENTISATCRVVDADNDRSINALVLVGRPGVNVSRLLAQYEASVISAEAFTSQLMWYGHSGGSSGLFTAYDLPRGSRVTGLVIAAGYRSALFSIKIGQHDATRLSLVPVRMSR